MSASAARKLGWSLFAVVIALLVAMVALSAGREEAFDTILYGLLSFTFAMAGALIVSGHPGNVIGWLFLAQGLSNAVSETGEGWGYVAADEGLPGGAAGEWIILWSWILDFAVFTVVFLLFPTGRLPGRRWRPWLWLLAAGTVLAIAGQSLNAGLGSEFSSGVNPLGVEALPADLLLSAGLTLMMVALVASLTSLFLRFRRGHQVERQQMKLIGLAACLLLVVFAIAIIPVDGEFLWYRSIVVQIAVALAFAALPVAVAVAILRYRLYDIEVVINRTIVYGALTATLAATYLGSVLLLQLALSGLTESSNLAIAGSTLAVAALFRPARVRIQEIVDRRFYRKRFDARLTLESFSARLRDEVDLAALEAELRGVIAETMQPAHVSLWLRGTEGTR